LNSCATFAQQFQLTPGVGLTAAQMAQLTSDIVRLVEQSVTLPDGSVQKVLVPQLYVRVKEGDINGAGALLAGDSVDLKLTGDVTNSGGTIFKANPTIRPGMEGQSPETIERRQAARIQHLESELRTFRANIEKIKKGRQHHVKYS